MTTLEKSLAVQLSGIFACEGQEATLAHQLERCIHGQGSVSFPADVTPLRAMLVRMKSRAKSAERALASLEDNEPLRQRNARLEHFLSLSCIPAPWHRNPSLVLRDVVRISYRGQGGRLQVEGQRQQDFSPVLWQYFNLTVEEVLTCNQLLGQGMMLPGDLAVSLNALSMMPVEARKRRLAQFVPLAVFGVMQKNLYETPLV